MSKKAAFKKSAAKKTKKAELSLLLCSAQLSGAQAAELYGATPDNPKTILIIAYATSDQDKAFERLSAAFEKHGIKAVAAHKSKDPVAALDKVDGVYVNGGNTFRLVDKLQKTGLDKALRRKVKAGMPYMGSSAGTNVACPTMMTTNDMPIVEPASFKAINIVPFQINAHYFAGAFKYDDDGQGNYIPYAGETRDDRLIQFQEENDIPVLGLRESTALRIRGDKVELLAVGPQSPEAAAAGQPWPKPVRVFEVGKAPYDTTDNAVLTAILQGKKPSSGPKPKKNAPKSP